MKKSLFWSVLALALIVTGCAGQKEPATQAVAQIETSLSSLRADAEQYASEELQQADHALASLKESLANKDYKAVVAAATSVSAQVSALQQTIDTRRDEMEAAISAAKEQWTALSADVPNMLSAIQTRIGTLSKMRTLPRNVSSANFQNAKDGLEFIKNSWAEATADFDAGNALDAVSKAQAAKDKGTEVLSLPGMS
ncbi:hypothetical protein ACG33_05810 [Steroidobacter denitrificans]|uniref:DUF4398 domain-containing protein n=1 Tax=Steroidobacter denitrificans TaxID=465721 RepID=A0A127FAK6_STEDE|nr:hypothetical protein [Steroidobacter denitrificans]AMN46620.1 hypothetical protein ACG33_05810 [Steroidobacter denitrificans]